MLNKIYIINLDKRTDRWKHVEQNVIPLIPKKHSDKVVRFAAVDHTHYPRREQRAAGCSYSHLGIWKDAIKNNYENILVLEDDVKWLVDYQTIEKCFDFFDTVDYNMIHIAYRNESEIFESNIKELYRCHDFTGTVAYFGKVDFLKKMLSDIEFSASQLMQLKPTRPYAIDIYWRKYQLDDKWYGSNKIAWTIDNYSNIENRNEKYKENENV